MLNLRMHGPTSQIPTPAKACLGHTQMGRTCSRLLHPYKMAYTPPAPVAVFRPGSSFGSPSSPSGRFYGRFTALPSLISFSSCGLPWVPAPGHPCLRQPFSRFTRPSPQNGDGRTPSQPRQRATQLGLQQDAAECREPPPGKVCMSRPVQPRPRPPPRLTAVQHQRRRPPGFVGPWRPEASQEDGVEAVACLALPPPHGLRGALERPDVEFPPLFLGLEFTFAPSLVGLEQP